MGDPWGSAHAAASVRSAELYVREAASTAAFGSERADGTILGFSCYFSSLINISSCQLVRVGRRGENVQGRCRVVSSTI